MTNLFVQSNGSEATANANQLEKTARLTTQATTIANTILKKIEEVGIDEQPEFQQKVKNSMKDHAVMDSLIDELYDLNDVEIDYLKDETEDLINRMIKSQQSKRSRSKGKDMTLDNYRTMLVGAIAENLLRLASGKEKSNGSLFSSAETIYDDEALAEFASDTESLKKAIRNIQSRKSIAKSKRDFDESSDKWQQLLEIEAKLKALRDGGAAPKANKAVETISKISEVLAGKDVNFLKANDSKALIAAIMGIVFEKPSVDKDENDAGGTEY